MRIRQPLPGICAWPVGWFSCGELARILGASFNNLSVIYFMNLLTMPHRTPLHSVFLVVLIFVATDVPALAAPENSTVSTPSETAASGVPAATTEPTPVKLEEVVVTSSSERDDRRESTVAKIVVTREDLDRFGDATVADVLKRVPGVTVSGAAGRGGEIRMRGLGSGYTLILLNGDPVAPGFSIDSLSPDMIERIEVMRAPTADKSNQAIAGTINIILKKVVHERQKNIKTYVANEYGKPSESLSGQFSDRAGTASYTLAGEIRHEEYFSVENDLRLGSDPQGHNLTGSRSHLTYDYKVNTASLTPRVNWNANDRDAFTLDGLISYQQTHTVWPQTVDTFLGSQPLIVETDPFTRREISTARGKLTWVRTLEDSAQLEVKLGLNESLKRQIVTYNNYDATQILQLLRSIDGPAADKSITLSGKYHAPFMPKHALSVGGDAEHSLRSESRIQNDLTPTGLVTPDNLNEVFDAKVDRLALFAQDEWEINPRWSIYEGLRWEGLDTHSSGNDFTSATNRSSVLSPILQSLWKVPDTKDDQVRISLSRTYKAPTTRDLSPRRYVGSLTNSQTSPDTEGNPDLRPEIAWGLDAAYEHYLGEAGMLSASVFERKIHDVTMQQLFYSQGIWITRPFNDGNAQSHGIELEAKASLRKLQPTAPAVDLRCNVARNWSTVDAVPGPNNRLSQQTPLSINLGADWKPDHTPLTLGGNFGFMEGGLVTLSANQTAATSVNRQLDAYGLWKLDTKAQLRLGLSNLLHQTHTDSGTYTDATGSQTQISTSPSVVAARLTLELKL